MCVCPSVREDISGTIRAIFTKFLCVLPMSMARSFFGTLTIGCCPHRLSTEGGDGSAQHGRCVIYDCLVITAVCRHFYFLCLPTTVAVQSSRLPYVCVSVSLPIRLCIRMITLDLNNVQVDIWHSGSQSNGGIPVGSS